MTVHSHACLMRGKLPVPTTSLQIKKHFPRIKADDCGLNFVSSLLSWSTTAGSVQDGRDLRRFPAQSPSQSGAQLWGQTRALSLWSQKPLRTEMTQPPWVLLHHLVILKGEKTKKILLVAILNIWFLAGWLSFHLPTTHDCQEPFCLLNNLPPSHWEAAVGPPLEVTSSPGWTTQFPQLVLAQ